METACIIQRDRRKREEKSELVVNSSVLSVSEQHLVFQRFATAVQRHDIMSLVRILPLGQD